MKRGAIYTFTLTIVINGTKILELNIIEMYVLALLQKFTYSLYNRDLEKNKKKK